MARKLTVLEILLIVFVLIVLAIDVLLLYLVLENPDTSFVPVCPESVSESERIDCAPGKEVTENICTQKYKCCWKLASSAQVPKCFFPQNWGYKISDPPDNTSTNYIARLEKLPSPSLFGEDVADTRFTAEFQTSNRFHFKITDFYNARYEVPHENVKLLNQTMRADNANANYLLEVTDNPFSFKLKRKSNSKVLLDTSIGPLQFAQQYLQLSFRLPSANVYGLGEHVHQQYRHSMTWKTWPIFTSDTRPTEDMKNLYGAHTFFLCLEDTSGNSFGVFLMNSNAMEVTLQPAPAITYRTTGGILDFYVFLGNTPEQVVQEYLEVVGKPFMPSYWNLGFQLSRRDYGGIEGLKKVINRTQEAMIPYDVQYFDIDYMNEGKDFTIDENKFPNLLHFTKILRQQGLKCVMIMHPGISNDSNYQPYKNGSEKGVWIRENNNFIVGQGYPGWTVFPDYSNPSGVEWWKEEFKAFSTSLEFDGVWIEMNELSSFLPSSSQTCEENILNNPPFVPQSMRPLLYEGTICMDAEFYEEFHYNLHSLYGYFMTRATDLALKNISGEKRNFILSRSTFAGSGKFAGHWLGNNAASWNDIRWSIPSILEFNLFGIPLVGANICGYLQNVTEELCRRWMQLGAFYPLARNHNGPGFRDQDPAAFGINSMLVASSKHYLSIRYTLLPYLYTLFYRAHTLGETVARPLVHEFYQDPETWGIHEQFMWGPGLLITPVLYEGADAVKAYIPDAIWYDYETGVAMQSRKQLVEMKLSGDQIGLHLRGGYIFPTQEPDVNTEKSRHRPLGLIIALDHKREAKGELYWDDGESKDAVTNKRYILYEFSVASNHLQATIINNNYSSVILNFTYFKFLGMDKKPNFIISSNGMQITNGNITYNASTKVSEVDVQMGLIMGSNFSFEWSFSVDNLEKFNCFPEEPNVSSDSCQNRGCLWEDTGEAGVPLCYYDTIPKYAATNIQYLPEGITTQLTYLTPPESAPVVPPSPPRSQAVPPPLTTAASGPLSEEVRVLNVKVIYHTQSILQFKIYDPNNKRYEVPVPLNTPSSPVNCSKDCLYEVKIQNNPFGIQIRRKGSGTVIWDSQLPGFTFNDKFLSISTRLPSQYVYGLGENEHTSFSKNMNWTTWGMFARDEPPEYRTNSYGVHPYYMALEMDGSAHGVLLLNSNAMDVTLQPTPALTFRTTGGILDFYMVLGPTPELVTQQYTELIGRPAMVPYWALGFQLSRRGYQNDVEIYNLYQEMMESKIPYDVQHVDVDYMDRKLGFTISPKFQNLEHFIWHMKNNGMRFIIILNPAISGNETQYLTFTRGKENDVFIKWPDSSDIVWGKALPDLPNVNGNESLDHESQMYKAHVAFPDFFRNSTAAWWKKEIQELYTNPLDPEKSLKFDGLWIDMNEPTNFVNGSITSCKDEILNKPPYMPYLASRDSGLSIKTLCMESQQTLPDGSLVQHYNVHSLYGWSQTRPTFEAVQEVTGQRGVVITRSTFPSSGRWGGYWLGDNMSKWDQLKKSIIGMMEFSLFGIPYTGANICGFLAEAEYEMCIRWMQLGAFYPFSRNHNTIGTRRQDPVAWDEDFKTMSREVLQTRYKLLPYLYTLMHKAHVEGSTVVRPLLHEFMNDTMTWKIDEQFMLGPAILISPVLQSNTSKINAYFPESRWLDYYTETLIESAGERKVLETPLNRINLHIRAGYIVPWQEPGMNTYLSRQQVMGLIIVLNESLEAEGEMFWDDGQSIDAYEKGDYFLAKFLAQNNTLKIQTTHNNYLSASNPLKFGHITIWGIESTLVTGINFTSDNDQPVNYDFQCDPNKQKLSINLTDNISLEKLKEVIWIHGDSPPVTPTPIPPVITTTHSSLSPPVTTTPTPPVITTTHSSLSPPVTTTPTPPVITTTHSSLSPPVTTTPTPPVITTTHSSLSPPVTTTPTPPVITTTHSSLSPPVTTTPTPPVITTTHSSLSPPVTTTPTLPVITTTHSSLSPPVTTVTPSPPVVTTTTHSSLSPPVTTVTPSPPVTTTPTLPVITTTYSSLSPPVTTVTPSPPVVTTIHSSLSPPVTTVTPSPPVTTTPTPPVVTTTHSSLSPPVTTVTPSPPVTTTPTLPGITTTHSSLSPPVTTITPSPPVTTTPISPVITTTPRPSETSTTQMTNTISTSPLYSFPSTTEDTTVEWYPGSTTEIKPTSTAGTRSPPPATASVFPTQTTESTTIPTAATTTTTTDTTVDLTSTSTTITDKTSRPIITTSTITATTPTTTSITDTSAVATSTTIYATTVTKNTSTFSPTTITSSTNATSTIMTTMTDPASTTNHDATTSTPKVSNTDTIASPNPTLPMTTDYFPTSNTEDTTNTNTSEITTTTINNTLSTSLSTDSISPITNSPFPETSSEVTTSTDPNMPFSTLFTTSNTAVPNTTPATNTPMTTNTNAATVANLTTTINSFSTSTTDTSISDATPTVDVNTISTALSDSTFPITSNPLPPSSTEVTNSTTVSDTFSTRTTEITMAVTNTTANTSSTSTTASNNFPVTTSSFPNYTEVTATTKVSDTTTHIVNTFATTLSTDSRNPILPITNSTFSANITEVITSTTVSDMNFSTFSTSDTEITTNITTT